MFKNVEGRSRQLGIYVQSHGDNLFAEFVCRDGDLVGNALRGAFPRFAVELGASEQHLHHIRWWRSADIINELQDPPSRGCV